MQLPEHRGRMALVGAMQEELAALLACMPDAQCETVAGRQFWVGHFEGHDVVAVLSGIGKVAAALTATLLIDKFQVRSMLFTGVAGGLSPAVKVGDVVVASDLLQHDMDASPLFPKYEVPLLRAAQIPNRSKYDGVVGSLRAKGIAIRQSAYRFGHQW
jgi:adenosylhomocysteine nucleosidase